jgi:cytochrome c2
MKGSPVVDRGEKLVELLACRRCHTHGRKGSRLAVNLERLALDIAPPAIFDSIKSPVLFMPNFYCDNMQIASLVNAILAVSEPVDPRVKETAQVVHFEDEKMSTENSFVKQCGPCHRILSERYGALGKGDIGPNLSGLLSEFYPKTYRDAEAWKIDKLLKWIENPLNSRPSARMRPVRLTTGEFTLLVETLSINTKATR